MVTKRRMSTASYSNKRSKTINNDLLMIKRKLKVLEPEMKYMVHGVQIAQLNNASLQQLCLTDLITQGTNKSQRVGDQIRVWKIVVSGNPTGNTNLGDAMVYRLQSATPAAITNFTNTVGALLDPSIGKPVWKLANQGNGASSCNIYHVKRFPSGLLVQYDATVTKRNPLYYLNINNSGANITNISYSIAVWYTDA